MFKKEGARRAANAVFIPPTMYGVRTVVALMISVISCIRQALIQKRTRFIRPSFKIAIKIPMEILFHSFN